MASLVGRVRAARYRPRLAERAAVYRRKAPDGEVHATQLQLLNREWERTVRTVPWFRALQREAGLPLRFASLEEFVERVPTMNRSTIQQHKEALLSADHLPEWMRITGGSTAQPVQIPAWKSERDALHPDMWAARGWYGIGPESRAYLLWGHSHLLGTGLVGWLRGRQRELFDRMLGYRRFSAYDLRPDSLRQAAQDLIRFRPDYLIGYSVALDIFARAAASYRNALRAVGMRMVVGAAEAFPAPDSEARLADLFDCPVAMEYGAVETNLVAHTHPEGGYRVFWRSYIVEADGEAERGPVRVTSLYPRCVPLIRYEIGDEIELWQPDEPRVGISSFRRVLGRCNDYVLLPGSAPIHSEAVTHAVRPCAAIRSYQVVQSGTRIELHYTGERELTPEEAAGIVGRLGRIAASLADVPLVRVAELQRTIAGKTPMVLRRT